MVSVQEGQLQPEELETADVKKMQTGIVCSPRDLRRASKSHSNPNLESCKLRVPG